MVLSCHMILNSMLQQVVDLADAAHQPLCHALASAIDIASCLLYHKFPYAAGCDNKSAC